jgi:hypothetical protein
VLDHQGVSEMAGHGVLVICPQLMKSAQCQSVVPSPLETHTGIASGTLLSNLLNTLRRLTVPPSRVGASTCCRSAILNQHHSKRKCKPRNQLRH